MTPTELSGKIVRITFHSPDTYFTVAKIVPKGKKQEITAIGTMPFVQIGLLVQLQGIWKIDPKHGRQFAVEKFTYELPHDKEGIVQFLSSGVLPGIGQVFAKRIADHFGESTIHVLDSQTDKLYEIPGLSKKKVQSIIASWQNHSQFQELSHILLSWGITHRQAAKILQKWGHESVKILQENPYTLAKEIKGIGFQLADAIAKSLGFDPHSEKRLDAAIEFLLWEKANEGHTAPPLEEFIATSSETLQVTKEEVQESIKKAVLHGFVFLLKPADVTQVQLKHMRFLEQSIAMSITRLNSAPSCLRAFDVEKALEWAEKTVMLTLHSTQRDACRTSLTNQLSIITGGPGTGKSTIIRVILEIYKKLTKKIILAAPTGKAAKRLFEITHTESKTIHRLLHYSPIKNSFEYNAENPLPADVIVIDEASMLDSQLTYYLFRAIAEGTKVVIVGDVHQLPSIGPGAVLSDLITSGKIATTHLTEVFRQAQKSAIIQSAHRILHGDMPYLKNFQGSDFLFFSKTEPEEAQKTILELVTNTIPEQFGFDSKQDIQVLSPMKKGALGCDAMNSLLQGLFANKQTSRDSKVFLMGDKVMQIKNNYNKDVYNGDVGWVVGIDHDIGSITVAFDERTLEYSPLDQEELILAWAVSVHKYQGSEVPCVVIPVHTQHFKMLTRNLLYTAVTRGKKLVVLVGSIRAVAIAVHQKDAISRWTGLKGFLHIC